jgi:hypothetical protein
MENNDPGHGGEAVCAPLVHYAVTFRPEPAFQFLDNVPAGDSEPCAISPVATSAHDPLERLELLFWRPRMWCEDVESLRDVLCIARGFSLAQAGGHAFEGEDELTKYIHQRFPQSAPAPWTAVLLKEFSDRPYLEACQEIAQILHDWRASSKK